ncbi:ABC-type transporter Mla subunit MlaD [Ancylobacter sp. 3268]|uniref:phage tail tape measure protein n=1 Tax=Ancylobacter sp. 3268 TaxID=2817752 RepID=UPI00285D3267|nr:phage tail tape measure protein [Ancylobacter sp. 3268]MDR6954115.1 ABC-type transporter Mla subunit MlaD [Ancylobacter sp. 3268]
MAPSSRTASLRLQLIDSFSGNSKSIANSAKSLDQALSRLGKSGAPGVGKLTRQLEGLREKAGAINEFRGLLRGLKETSVEMKVARSRVKTLEAAFGAAAKPTKQMETQLRSARAALKQSTQAFRDQGQAALASMRNLRTFGINSQKDISGSQRAIRKQMADTIRQIRQMDRELRNRPSPAPIPRPSRPPAVPRPAGGGAGSYSGRSPERESAVAVGGGIIASKVREGAQQGFTYAVDFSRAADYQQALGGFSSSERGMLNQQAKDIGGETRFSNVDVIQAQTQILQGGIRDTKTIMNLTRQVTDYSLAMGVTLEEGAETIRGAALSKRVDLSDVKAIKNFVDSMVWMAKNSGMSDDDVRQYMKYGGASTTGAGLPDPYSAAVGMILRRSGVRGDEAGVFARSASSKLVAPTKKGRDALAAMGINYSDYVRMPDALNSEGIGIMMKNNFGKRLTPEMEAKVKDLLENGEFTDPETGETRSVSSDSGEFVTRMTEILEPLFTDNKGKVPARDASALSKGLADYHKYSVDSVDVVGLFNSIMSSNPTLGNLNAFFTDRQGGRANMIAQQWALFQQFRQMMEAPPTGVANKIGTEANKGLYGDWTKLTGTIETALTTAVQDWEGVIRPVIKTTDDLVSELTEAGPAVRRLAEAAVVAAGVLAAYASFKAGTGLIGDVLGLPGGGKGGRGLGKAGAAVGGAVAGKVGGSLLKRMGVGLLRGGTAVGTGVLAMDALDEVDPDGNLWGLTDPIDGWFIRNYGVNPSNIGKSRARGQYHSSVDAAKSKATQSELEKLDSAISSWPDKAKAAMDDYGFAIQQGGPEAEAKAAEIAKQIEKELSVTGHPDVDTTRLEKALNLARQVAGAINAIGGGGGGTEYVTPPNANKFGGPRADGGPVQAGKTYLVGERGPEPFIPSQNGRIMSNRDFRSAMGGGGPMVNMPVTIHLHGGATKSDAKMLVDVLDQRLNRAVQIAFGGANYGDA